MLQPIVHEMIVDGYINIIYGGNQYQVDITPREEDVEVWWVKDGINCVEVKPNCNLFDTLKRTALRWYNENC